MRPLFLQQFGVKFFVLLSHSLDSKVRTGESAGVASELFTPRLVPEQRFNCRHKLIDISRREKDATVIVDELGIPSNLARYYRHTRRHGLEDYVRETFRGRGK